jgi:2',3'-cyclic-nucleotide 2'-phosphodiesterase (5'-nucleotidase family)
MHAKFMAHSGNHEFDDGDKVLATFLDQLKSATCTVGNLEIKFFNTYEDTKLTLCH